jgi:hypothetical protein
MLTGSAVGCSHREGKSSTVMCRCPMRGDTEAAVVPYVGSTLKSVRVVLQGSAINGLVG